MKKAKSILLCLFTFLIINGIYPQQPTGTGESGTFAFDGPEIAPVNAEFPQAVSSNENKYMAEDGKITTSASSGGVTGNLAGSFDVLQNGAGVYSLPIPCLPDFHGMQPDISLNYNSMGGNGSAGWGWNLGGIPMIARGTKNYYHDEDKSGMVWGNDPALYMDGQRLIKLQTWGSPGKPDSVAYCLENETEIRIVGKEYRDWGPQFFTVYFKDGKTAVYGSYAEKGSYFPVHSKKKDNLFGSRYDLIYNLGWALVKITDTNNNYVGYSYSNVENSSTNYIRYADNVLAAIEYGNETGGVKVLAGKMDFIYRSRTDQTLKYINEMQARNNRILEKIQVKGKDNNVIETYTLTYTKNEDRDLLSSVKKTNADGESFLPLKFEWNNPSYSQQSSQRKQLRFTNAPWDNTYANHEIIGSGDVDGDGLTDFVIQFKKTFGGSDPHYWTIARNNGDGTFTCGANISSSTYRHASPMLIDTDNDGKDEFLLTTSLGMMYNSVSIMKFAYPNTSTGTVAASITVPKAVYDQAYPVTNPKMALYTVPGNFLGNGEVQYMVFSRKLDGDNNEKNTVQGFGPVSNVDLSAIEKGDKYSAIYLTDINGNGKTELMFIKGNTTWFYEFNQSRNAFECILTLENTFSYLDSIITGDFNGDGNTDILLIPPNNTTNSCRIYLSDGATLVNSPTYNISSHMTSKQRNTQVLVMDANKDGKSDILFLKKDNNTNYLHPYELVLLLSNNGTFEKKILNYNFYIDDIQFVNSARIMPMSSIIKLGHTEGNVDILCNIEKYHAYFTINIPDYLNKISKITDSYSNTTSITYQKAKSPFSDRNNPSQDEYENLSAGNVADINFEVVKNVQFRNGNRLMSDVEYKFTDAKTDTKARGFLGFLEMEASDYITKRDYFTTYKYNSTYRVLYPYREITKTSGGVSLTESVSNYSFSSPASKRYFMRPDSQVSKDFLTGVSVTTTFSSYDSARNPQTVTTSYGNGFTTRQDMVYIKKGSHFTNKVKTLTLTKKATGQSDYIRKTEYGYDSRGNLTEEIADKGDENMVTTAYKNYDKFGNAKQVSVTANGTTRTVSKIFNASGFPETETNHLNEKVTYKYNEAKALLTSVTGPAGTTSFQYDGFGRPATTVYPDNNRTSVVLRWAADGAPNEAKYYSYEEVTGGAPVKVWYDGIGRELRSETYGLNNKKVLQDTEYYSDGLLRRISKPYFEGTAQNWEITYGYDNYGRVSTATSPQGVTSYAYDKLVTTRTAPDGVYKTTLNSAGQTVTSEQYGKKASFVYYASGQLKTATPQGGKPVSMEYDLQGNRTKITDPNAGSTQTKYNGWGQVINHKYDGKAAINYEYYDNGLLKKQNNISYEYDSRNRLEVEKNNNQTKKYQYDSYDRVKKITDNGKVSEFVYDSYGRVEKEIYPSGYYVQNIYDARGYLTDVKDSKGNLIWQAVEVDAEGRITKSKQGTVTTTFTFDSRGFPKTISAPNITNQSYTFNTKGNLTNRKETITKKDETFTYDDMNRLESGGSYDDNGNKKLTMARYSYGENGKPHALTRLAMAHPDYTEHLPEAGEFIYYANFNKPLTFDQIDGNFCDLFYGTDNERVQYTTTGITRYYYGNYEEEHLQNNSGQATEIRKIHYIYGGNGIAGVYIEDNKGNNLYYTYTDYLGSLIALVKPSGTVSERYYYTAWGKRIKISNTGSTLANQSCLLHRGYTMHEHMDNFSYINMNGRIYDPITMMFMSPDPYLQQPGNWLNYNRYSYCLNNPFKYTDPSGELIHLIVGAAIGGTVNWAFNGAKFNLKGLGYFGVGALSGAVGAGMGAGVNSALAQGSFGAGFFGCSSALTAASSFVSGAAIGGSAGFSSGFVIGFGNSIVDGQSFDKSLGKGGLYGLIGGASGGITGGIYGGIDAVRNGREFWDGATVTKKYYAETDVISVKQMGANNCLPASGESINKSFGGNVIQEEFRRAAGGHPEFDGINDKNFWENIYQPKTGHSVQSHSNMGAKNIVPTLNNGGRVALTIPASDAGYHSVVVKSVYYQTVVKVNGKVTSDIMFRVMDPATGGFRNIPLNKIVNVFTIMP